MVPSQGDRVPPGDGQGAGSLLEQPKARMLGRARKHKDRPHRHLH